MALTAMYTSPRSTHNFVLPNDPDKVRSVRAGSRFYKAGLWCTKR